MSLTFPRQMPTGGVVSQGFEPLRVDYASSSTGGRLTSVTAGPPVWSMALTLQDSDPREAAEWRAFFASLRGAQRTFLAGDLTRPYPLAYLDGFDGLLRAGGGDFDGSAGGWSVNPDRDAPTFSGLPAGFRIQIGDYAMWRWTTGGVQRRALARAIEDADATAAGVLAVAMEPPLPNLTPGTAIADFARPQCVMKQVTDKSQLGELDALHSLSGSLVALQDLRP